MATGDSDYFKLELEEENLTEELLPSKTEDKSHTLEQTKSIIFALIAGSFFALHNFTLGSLAKMGYLARFDTGIGMGLGSLLYYTYHYYQCVKNGKKFFDWEKSLYRNQNPDVPEQERNKFEYWILAGVIMMAWSAVGGGVIVILSFKFALEGGMNQGIVTSIYGMTPFIASILFYFIFRETLKKSQLIGMTFMIVCIVMIGLLRAPVSEGLVQAEYNSHGVTLALILSVICPFFFAFDGLVVRLLSMKYRVDANGVTQAAFFCQGFIVLIGSVIGYSLDNYEFVLLEFLQMVLAGVIVNGGWSFLNTAISSGNAGVAYSLTNSQVIIFIILATVVLNQIPTQIEVIAVIIGIIGSCIMSIGPELYAKIKGVFCVR